MGLSGAPVQFTDWSRPEHRSICASAPVAPVPLGTEQTGAGANRARHHRPTRGVAEESASSNSRTGGVGSRRVNRISVWAGGRQRFKIVATPDRRGWPGHSFVNEDGSFPTGGGYQQRFETVGCADPCGCHAEIIFPKSEISRKSRNGTKTPAASGLDEIRSPQNQPVGTKQFPLLILRGLATPVRQFASFPFRCTPPVLG